MLHLPLSMTDAPPDAPAHAANAPQPEEGQVSGTAREDLGRRELALFLRLVQAHAQLRWNFCAFLFAAGLLGPLAVAVLLLASEEAALSRTLVWWILPALTGLFLLAGPLTSKLRFRSLDSIARRIAPRMPTQELRAGFLPAVELSKALDAGRKGKMPPVSASLAQAHVADTARRLREVEPGTLVKRGALARAFKFAFGAFFLSLGAGLFASDRLESGLRFIVRTQDEVQAAAAAPRQAEEPVTGDIRLTLTPPAYARRETSVIEGSGGEIFALKGTAVHLETRADRKTSGASVIFDSGAAVPLRVGEDGRSLEGDLTVSEGGRYRFRLEPADGTSPVEGPRIPVTLEEDAPPAIELTEPLADVEAESGGTVRIGFEASDDLGIRETALLYRLPGAPSPKRVVVDRPEGAPKSVSGSWDLDLAPLGLMSGDEVVFYLETLDTDVMDGPKASVSQTRVVKIYSRAEHHRQLMERLSAEWEKLIVLLGDRLESPERALGPGRAARDALNAGRELDAKMMALSAALTVLADGIGGDEAPEQLRSAIRNTGETLARNVRETMRLRELAASPLRPGKISEEAVRHRHFVRALAEEIAGTERAVLYLETLLDEQRAEDLKESAAELRDKQRQLSGLLEELRTSPDDETQARVFEEIARLKERMADLMKRMGSLSRSIQDAHVNAEALKEISEAGAAMDAFDRMQEMLARGEVEEAAKALDEIGQALETLERQLEGAAEELGSGVEQELGASLAQFAGDLDALSAAQKSLLQETRSLQEAEARRRNDKMEVRGEDFWNELRDKVRSAQESLGGIRLAEGYFGSEALRRAQESAGGLALALEVKSLERAGGFAAEAAERLEQLTRELERQRRFFAWGASAEALRRQADNGERAGEAARSIGEVKKALESLAEELSEGRDEGAEQAMQRLAEREAALSGRAEALQKRMDEINQSAPLFPEEARQLLREAAQQMAEAESGLKGAQSSRAARSQQAALDQLEGLRKGLAGGEEGDPGGEEGGAGGSAKPGGQKESASSQPGGLSGIRRIPWPWGTQRSEPSRSRDGRSGNSVRRDDSEKVRLPQAESYEVPEAYRRDILDAMKERAPERYREDIRRYYEEIIR